MSFAKKKPFQTGHALVNNERFSHRQYCIKVTPGQAKAVDLQLMLCVNGGPNVPLARHSILPYGEKGHVLIYLRTKSVHCRAHSCHGLRCIMRNRNNARPCTDFDLDSNN